jgi:hypothetical protein
VNGSRRLGALIAVIALALAIVVSLRPWPWAPAKPAPSPAANSFFPIERWDFVSSIRSSPLTDGLADDLEIGFGKVIAQAEEGFFG